MAWNYGNTIDTLVGGLVTVKVMESGMNMIDRASQVGSSRKKQRKQDQAVFITLDPVYSKIFIDG